MLFLMLYNFSKGCDLMNRIKELRAAKHIKQADLAILLNCTTATVSKYELMQRDIDSDTICRLCDIFGCTADYLLGRSELMTPELTDEEAAFVQALRRCDDRALDMVRTALRPFSEDAAEASAM